MRRGGGIGRRSRLKICRGYPRTGSSPVLGTRCEKGFRGVSEVPLLCSRAGVPDVFPSFRDGMGSCSPFAIYRILDRCCCRGRFGVDTVQARVTRIGARFAPCRICQCMLRLPLGISVFGNWFASLRNPPINSSPYIGRPCPVMTACGSSAAMACTDRHARCQSVVK